MAEFYINNNGEITDSNLSSLTKVDFNHFKINSALPPSPITHTPGPTRTPSMAILCMSNSQITLINFKKGTKRDLSANPTFKSEKYCYSFHTAARTQGLGDILDPKFHPKHSNTSTELLFNEQQSFMCSVLVVTRQTERGKYLTKEFEDDAQQILAELHDYHTKSEMTQHEIVELYLHHQSQTH